MSLSVGLVGLANAGKSTLFNALLGRQLSKVAEYPFTTIEPHEGVIEVPDERLRALANLVKPEKTTPATVTFVDIAGLVRGAHQGEGLGNEFLGHIREVDAIVHVVRAFEHPDAPHPMVTIDPERDIEIIETELLLKDLATLKKRLEEETDAAKKAFYTKLTAELDRGVPARKLVLNDHEKIFLDELTLLTAKPVFYVLNISEAGLAKGAQGLADRDFLVICAKLETELSQLSAAEQQEYLSSLGIRESGLTQVIKKAHQLLDLITFYTIKGGREVRAWPVKKGTSAIAAAARVHTDFAQKFIKAEVIPANILLAVGSWHQAHELGKVSLVGRDHLLTDGDVVEFKVGI